MPSQDTTRRGILIAGNWKMHKTLSEARSLAAEIAGALPPGGEPQVAVFPPAVALAAVAEVVAGSSRKITVGAQNMYYESEGAFTGELSAEMLVSAGAGAVLCGHSERRHVFGENDREVGRKTARALEAGLVPVLCVGETLEQREAGETMDVVARQLAEGLGAVSDPSSLSRVVVAYEPVWAIGTGRTATPAQGQEVHRFLRAELSGRLKDEQAQQTMILYGGSVKPENAADLLAEPDIDGLLVGGASLKAESFVQICQAGC